MKLIDIAQKIDKSKDNESWVDVTELADEFGIDLYGYIEQERLKSYWIGNWYCTDTWVGYRMYFLDQEPVAFSIQKGRKCNEDIMWFSKELALKVKEYLITLMSEEDDDLNIEICDIQEDIGESYKISFNSQILGHSLPMLKGEEVKILDRIRETPDYGIDQMLKIQTSNNEEKIIHISELDFKFHIK